MKSRRRIVFGLLGLLAVACAPLPAAANCLPLKRVMRSVAQQFNARVLDVTVDCATGQVLGVRGG